ncbi:hypothetical protein UFOVP847_52 [uncultured Caudovirales phage]|uniref:Uncharacterized protein n=1 Tax=uncultured Caudovirales phage TaxID=2100421 RepID=A0A6J5P9Z6_9CAUD|nr:hypothetical protein UFOVP847_52 [uncultured Caudovirales phage]
MITWTLRKDGFYLMTSDTGQRYEISEGKHGTWDLNIVGSHIVNREELQDCFEAAAQHEEETQDEL